MNNPSEEFRKGVMFNEHKKAFIDRPQTSYLSLDNHILECHIKALSEVLRYKGFHAEAEAMECIAARIK